MALKLNLNSIRDLPGDVAVPRYDRAQLSPGILHVGVGNFHRAHQAAYMDRLFDKGLDHDWALVGAGVMPADARMREQLEQQDWLSTVIELDPDGYAARVCGAMVDFAAVDGACLVRAMTDPAIRIVSLTITEGGYFLEPRTGNFESDHPLVRADAVTPDRPETVFGTIVAALQARKAAGTAPFTVMSCDNVPENGTVAKQAVMGMAGLMAPALSTWIDETVAFPNSMVDCITPATSPRERMLAAERFGIDDPAVVVCEPFRQWVLEDRFPQGRPRLEEVGVEFVASVDAHVLMKLRILNGGHAAIAYPAALMGLAYAHEAMETPILRAYLEKLERDEIIPTVPPVPGVDLEHYLEQTLLRFSNSAIGDTIPRLCADGSNRQPKFILPTLVDRLHDGLPVAGLALVIASWCRYCAGTDDAGKPHAVEDNNADRLRRNALLARTDAKAFLGMADIFGPAAESDDFVAAFSTALASLWEHGTAHTLSLYVNGDAA